MSEYVQRVSRLPESLLPRLPHLDIELTERCDNDCIHCCINLPAGHAAARAREMTTQQVMGIMDQAAGLGCLQVRLTGGEPLLHPEFEQFCDYALSKIPRMQLGLWTCLPEGKEHLRDAIVRTFGDNAYLRLWEADLI